MWCTDVHCAGSVNVARGSGWQNILAAKAAASAAISPAGGVMHALARYLTQWQKEQPITFSKKTQGSYCSVQDFFCSRGRVGMVRLSLHERLVFMEHRVGKYTTPMYPTRWAATIYKWGEKNPISNVIIPVTPLFSDICRGYSHNMFFHPICNW